MQVKNENQVTAAKEFRIITRWVIILALVAFFAVQILFHLLMWHESSPPAWARALLGLLLGVGAGTYVLFLGYINRDAKRRGMSPTLWTLVAFLIPYALGILLYFVLRQPVQMLCAQCGHTVQAGFSFCPRCSHKLTPSCPQCHHVGGQDDTYCAYCGTALAR